MAITIKDIQSKWPNSDHIEQIDSKQLFKAVIDGRPVLISYLTIVGYLLHDDCGAVKSVGRIWHLTSIKHSRITSKQLSQFSRGRAVHWCNAEEWEALNSN